MMNHKDPVDNLLSSLQERAKELSCLYAIEEILDRDGIEISEVCTAVIEVIPPGWQYPDV